MIALPFRQLRRRQLRRDAVPWRRNRLRIRAAARHSSACRKLGRRTATTNTRSRCCAPGSLPVIGSANQPVGSPSASTTTTSGTAQDAVRAGKRRLQIIRRRIDSRSDKRITLASLLDRAPLHPSPHILAPPTRRLLVLPGRPGRPVGRHVGISMSKCRRARQLFSPLSRTRMTAASLILFHFGTGLQETEGENAIKPPACQVCSSITGTSAGGGWEVQG